MFGAPSRWLRGAMKLRAEPLIPRWNRAWNELPSGARRAVGAHGEERPVSLAFAFYGSVGTRNTPTHHSQKAFYNPSEVYVPADPHITGTRLDGAH